MHPPSQISGYATEPNPITFVTHISIFIIIIQESRFSVISQILSFIELTPDYLFQNNDRAFGLLDADSDGQPEETFESKTSVDGQIGRRRHKSKRS